MFIYNKKYLSILSIVLCLFSFVYSDRFVYAASKEDAELFAQEYKKTSENYNIDHGEMLYINNVPGKEIIIDVDMSTDVDDVCALSIACALDSLEVITLSAVGISVNSSDGTHIEALEGLLDSYNKKDVPIGTCTGEFIDTSPYWNTLSDYKIVDHDIMNAVSLYRKILNDSNDYVDIVTTGFLTNISALLQSEPDNISSLSGMELVKEKCGQLYITGGSMDNGYDSNFGFTEEAISSIKYVNDNWPLPICYLTNDSGSMEVGDELQKVDIYRSDASTNALYAFGADNGRAAWDPFAVYVCAYGSGKSGNIRYKRINTIFYKDGTFLFEDNKEGRHYRAYRSLDDSNYEDRMESLLLFHL